ncbi:hypothetical protein Cob_v010935 [Colletotrichum orbiculare MAFF 240422]|uniref:Uncharacterized protein n=1 Tax=Colletotrichum orbiculare (strain 104-T / ATCC 96160 / CBS 514.97 / LARS 414 / MAFF 240422) TaxID=1213857 RepID=A0A484FCS3_COLOR|nr:hypothetical protein Cob_v010935 [Colletotrichum orbiculare MAFF 240422]
MLPHGWFQSRKDYIPQEHQRLIYGGTTSLAKASLTALLEKGEQWISENQGTYDTSTNCLHHYWHLERTL